MLKCFKVVLNYAEINYSFPQIKPKNKNDKLQTT